MINFKRAARASIRRALSVFLPLATKLLHRSRPTRHAVAGGAPRRILLLNGAHIGDIVISTSILPILRSAYPNAQIGFATGSWSKMVLEDHPDVDFVHCIDHWILNRGPENLFRRIRRYHATRKIALREIREAQYDLAISLYTFSYPDLINIAWCAGIPVRLAFRQSLFSSLATAVTDASRNDFLVQGAIQAEVLRPLSLDLCHLKKRRATLPDTTDKAIRELCALLQLPTVGDVTYSIVHMGSGALKRELPLTFWREVAAELSKSQTLVFTGKGEREAANASRVISGLPRCINACDRLSWDGFVAAVRFAQTVFGVESMAGHVAAAVGTRCVVAYTGMAGVARWRPESEDSTVITRHLSCAPCVRPRGCAAMACIRGTLPKEMTSLICESAAGEPFKVIVGCVADPVGQIK
jgi:heptosyltransferase-2